MKSIFVLSSLVAIGFGVPIHLDNENFQWPSRQPHYHRRDKKSSEHMPDHTMVSGLSFVPEEDHVPMSRHFKDGFLFKKPVVVRPIFNHGHHGHGYSYRETDGDEHLETLEDIHNDNMERKALWSVSDTHKEFEKSINIAKEAVDNIEMSFDEIEKKSTVRASDWKNIESDAKLHKNIQTAKEALELVQKSFNDFDHLEKSDMVLSASNDSPVKIESERMSQWKETIENIQSKNEEGSDVPAATQSIENHNSWSNLGKSNMDTDSDKHEHITELKESNEDKTSLIHHFDNLGAKSAVENIEASQSDLQQFPRLSDFKESDSNLKVSEAESLKLHTEHFSRSSDFKDSHVDLMDHNSDTLKTKTIDKPEEATKTHKDNLSKPSDKIELISNKLENKPNNLSADLPEDLISHDSKKEHVNDHTKKDIETLPKSSDVLSHVQGAVSHMSQGADAAVDRIVDIVRPSNILGLNNAHPHPEMKAAADNLKRTNIKSENKKDNESTHKMIDSNIPKKLANTPNSAPKNSENTLHSPVRSNIQDEEFHHTEGKNAVNDELLTIPLVFNNNKFSLKDSDDEIIAKESTKMEDWISMNSHPKLALNLMSKNVPLGLMNSEMINSDQKLRQWRPHHQSRGAYGVGAAGAIGAGIGALSLGADSGPAVGVFPNANVGGCAIPLLVSCSPSLVTGHLSKHHGGSYGVPSYRMKEDRRMKKRDTKKFSHVHNIKKGILITT